MYRIHFGYFEIMFFILFFYLCNRCLNLLFAQWILSHISHNAIVQIEFNTFWRFPRHSLAFFSFIWLDFVCNNKHHHLKCHMHTYKNVEISTYANFIFNWRIFSCCFISIFHLFQYYQYHCVLDRIAFPLNTVEKKSKQG